MVDYRYNQQGRNSVRPKEVLTCLGIGALIGLIGVGAYNLLPGSLGYNTRPSKAYPPSAYSGQSAKNNGSASDSSVLSGLEQKAEIKPAPEGSSQIARGVYFRQGRDESYPVNYFELIIDKQSGASLFVTEPNGVQTLSSLISSYDAEACVNGGPFNMEDGSLTVYTMYNGTKCSLAELRPDTPTVCFSGSNEISFGPSVPEEARYCLTGFNRLVSDGEPNKRYYPGNEGYKEGYSTRNPRTLLVDDAVNDWAYLVVVDGRSDSSVGLSAAEAIDFVRAHYRNATNVVNLDGGGSSELIFMSGSGQVIANIPSDGAERPISHAVCVKSGK